MPPLTIAQIKALRKAKQDQVYSQVLHSISNRAAALSDPKGSLTTISLPVYPAVFTVVSWNVQTFEAGKSLGNPFVNKIINRILDELQADVCVLLESRADSYVNMNAIETGLAGDKGWKQTVTNEEDDDGDKEEEDDDEVDMDEELPDDDEDDDDDDASDLVNGGEDLVYTQIVSDMTGKRWKPPHSLHVYHPWAVTTCRDIRDFKSRNALENKKKKLTQKEEKKKKRLNDKLKKLKKQDPKRYKRARNADKHLASFASSYNYHPKILKRLCVDSGDKPTLLWQAVLLQGQFLPIRSYYNLVHVDASSDETIGAWDQDLTLVPDTWRLKLSLKKCADCGESFGSGTCPSCVEKGPYTTEIENLRQAVDAITFYMCTCQESYSILLRQGTEVVGSSSAGQWIKDKIVSVKANAATLLARAPDTHVTSGAKLKIQPGTTLGFQEGSAGFYGRCPFMVPIELWLPYRDVSHHLKMVTFHGPFGASTIAGVELRAAAMREILKAGPGMTKPLGDEPDLMIVGDFNLDWSPLAKNQDSKQRIAGTLYDEFTKLGLTPLIHGGVPTSLMSIYGRAQWKTIDPAQTDNYLSSSYDNCFLRGDAIREHLACAGVIDVISWIEDNLADFPVPATDPQQAQLASLPKKTQAFYIYHKYVSDHLPILCDILVEPLTSLSRPLRNKARVEADVRRQRAENAQGLALSASGKLLQFSSVIKFDEMLDMNRTDAQEDSYVARSLNPKDEDDMNRIGTFVGVVEAHQDEHLILRCEPIRGQVAYCSWALPGRPTHKRQLLKIFPPGTRVKWEVSNPVPVQK